MKPELMVQEQTIRRSFYIRDDQMPQFPTLADRACNPQTMLTSLIKDDWSNTMALICGDGRQVSTIAAILNGYNGKWTDVYSLFGGLIAKARYIVQGDEAALRPLLDALLLAIEEHGVDTLQFVPHLLCGRNKPIVVEALGQEAEIVFRRPKNQKGPLTAYVLTFNMILHQWSMGVLAEWIFSHPELKRIKAIEPLFAVKNGLYNFQDWSEAVKQMVSQWQGLGNWPYPEISEIQERAEQLMKP